MPEPTHPPNDLPVPFVGAQPLTTTTPMAQDGTGLDDPLGGAISLGSVVAEKYRVDQVIGTGGMGVVVCAWHLQFEERVAIKFLLPQGGVDAEAVGRFEREARAAFKIKSEHVARVIDVGRVGDDMPYIVMEYLEGTDLGVMLTDRTALPVEAAVEYVMQACEAVAEAHALGIVHRDLKPENLFLTRRADGTPCIKVLDFGLSKVQGSGQVRERALTSAAQVMGTPQYMSPEQWMGMEDVGPASDQWALGVILYELLTGVQPFAREQLAQLCTQVLNGEPEPLARRRPDAPAGLELVVLRALRKSPDDRYANIAELALDLHHYGPVRAKASARRIAGVFRQAGIETTDLPESRRGGLGYGMVLGKGPGPGGPAADDSVPGPVAASPSASGGHAAAAPALPAVEPEPQTIPMPRTVTGQAWQSELEPMSLRGRKKVVIAVLAAITISMVVALALLFSSPTNEVEPAAASGDDGKQVTVGSDTAAAQPGQLEPGDAGAAAVDAAGGHDPDAVRAPRPAKNRIDRPVPEPPPATSKTRRGPGMFDHR